MTGQYNGKRLLFLIQVKSTGLFSRKCQNLNHDSVYLSQNLLQQGYHIFEYI